MNYTKLYRDIYESLEVDSISHEALHSICLRLCDALNDYHLIVNGHELTKLSPGSKLASVITPKVS
jgi:hypothetical protein